MSDEQIEAAAEKWRNKHDTWPPNTDELMFEVPQSRLVALEALADWAVARLAAERAERANPTRHGGLSTRLAVLAEQCSRGEYPFGGTDWPSSAAYEHARQMVIDADRAEREERDRPIDEAWLRDTGFGEHGLWISFDREQLQIEPTSTGIELTIWDDHVSSVELMYISTRGQLLDLLAALGVERKGGAE